MLQTQDRWVNDYVPAISMLWQANTDVQYVWSGVADVVQYITGYTTKSEKSKEGIAASMALQAAATGKEVRQAFLIEKSEDCRVSKLW